MHSAATIASWLDRILGHEGGYSSDRNDPGNWTGGHVGVGKLLGTKYGIAANTYPHLDIPRLTIDDAVEIYQRDYLALLQADQLEPGVAFQLLDFAVNSGPARAIRALQLELGIKPDGKVGPVTLGAIRARSEADLVMLLLAHRLEFMTGLPNWAAHGKGWSRRIAEQLRWAAQDT